MSAAGRWLEGLQFVRRGLDLATREHKVRDKIPLLAISGNIHLFLQNFHLAIRAMREAIAIAEQSSCQTSRPSCCKAFGPVYSHLELHETALSVFERAFSMATKQAARRWRAAALNNMAREFCALGRTAEAGTRIDDAMAIAQAPALREWLPNLLHTAPKSRPARAGSTTRLPTPTRLQCSCAAAGNAQYAATGSD